MLSKLASLIKKHSFTDTPATEGFDSMEEVVPGLEEIHKKLRVKNRSNKLTADELNLIIKHDFKCEELTSCHFKLNLSFFGSTFFELEDIEVSKNRSTGELSDLTLTFKEEAFGSDVRITMPIESMREFLIPITKIIK